MTDRASVTPKWMTISEVAEYLSVSIAAIRKYLREDSFPHTRLGKRDRGPLRFDREKVDEWVARRSAA